MIELKLRNTEKTTLLDSDVYERLKHLSWRILKRKNERNDEYAVYTKCWKENGKRKFKVVYLHRLVIEIPEGMFIDHIDRDKLNNLRSNLRVCTDQQNRWNSPPHKGQKYKGVRSRYGKWRYRISKDRKRYESGSFDTPEEAALAYNVKAKELFGEFAYLNNI